MRRFRGVALWTSVAILLAAWPHLLLTRLYDPDELEHLHAAYSVASGKTLYRDFFEHHGPLAYIQLAPFVHWIGAKPVLLTVHRILCAAWLALGLGATAWLARRLGGHAAVAPALLFLLSFCWFTEKAVEGRPDVPAMALVVIAACFLHAAATGRNAFLPAAAGGLLLGAAALFTQKSAFVSLGLILGAVLSRWSRNRPLGAAILGGTLGASLPWIAAVVYFFSHDALQPFLERVLVTPVVWPRHTPDPEELLDARLLSPIQWAPGQIALILCTLVVAAKRLFSRRGRRRGEPIPVLACLVHFAALPIMPAAYLQFYLLAWPLTAVLAGAYFGRCFLVSHVPKKVHSLRLCVLCAVVFLGGLALRRDRGELQLRIDNPFHVVDFSCLALLVVGALLTLAARTRKGGGRAVGTLLVFLATMLPSLGRVGVQHYYWASGNRQVQALDRFMARVAPEQAVQDGFSGLGCLRPHACYWWWINRHSLPLMRREGALRDFSRLLEAGVPAFVILDENLAGAGSQTVNLLAERYRPYYREGAVVILQRHDLTQTAKEP